ncbi:hypothetical protein BVRB_3g054200 [Beta vulgaris subsp. vulgaris]|nr:hypothetical protein BVRB_3g054200 [Beta vulgaris subsp. vulgaris]
MTASKQSSTDDKFETWRFSFLGKESGGCGADLYGRKLPFRCLSVSWASK